MRDVEEKSRKSQHSGISCNYIHFSRWRDVFQPFQ